jgi:hypothetical protein
MVEVAVIHRPAQERLDAALGAGALLSPYSSCGQPLFVSPI